MIHIEFSPSHIAIGYLLVGLLILALRIAYDCVMYVATAARGLAAKNNVSVTRGAVTLVICGVALICMAIVFWPDVARSALRKWWAR